jgi:UDP-N-acetylglucosamine diphosphorylase / glucose-1-phosphate thymidylyltransferase / UDP-N-acetylgalactosamine diphosphorylase / glucosamine-1-phosphate N-acetyltransferase / galactosamine-1-phosphate N-acetyltransferase
VVRHAIVMAAGEGRRLRPLTERWPKPVLPIDGRPVLGTLLRELAAAGVERAFVVTGHLAEQVRALAGDGGAWGLEVRFADQPRPDGSADAVARALAAGAEPPCLVAGADTVFGAGDVGRFVESAQGRAAIAVRRDPPPAPPHRFAVASREGVVTTVLDDDPANPFAAAPLWLLTDDVVPHLRADRPPYELGNAFQAAIAAGVPVSAVEIGRTRDLTDPLDLVEENFPYLNRTT